MEKLYGIYEISYCASWKVQIRLSDAKYQHAVDGDAVARSAILRQYKAKVNTVHGKPMELFVGWGDKYFDIRRVSDAYPPQPHPSAPKDSDGCDCECTRCDIGYHCHSTSKSCHLRP